MTKVAILGANGFLGSPISAELKTDGFDVVNFSRSKTVGSSNSEFIVDLFDRESLRIGLKDSKPDVVISTAWYTEPGKFWTSDLNNAYKDATLRFAELCFEFGVNVFFGLGTMSEYGDNPGFCNAASTSLVPVNEYSKAKIETGLELKKLGEVYNRKTNWLRIFQAFGENEKSARFIPGLISTLRGGNPFSIRTPNFEMDWIHTSDIASAVSFCLKNQLNHSVDVGTGKGTSVKDLSELICAELDLDLSLLDYSSQIPGHEKKATVDSNSELLSLGWAPAKSLRTRINSLR
jgi:nucleoside-diphosphate-sugar epimerase